MIKRYYLKYSVALLSLSFLSLTASAQGPYRLADKEIKPLLERIDDNAHKFSDTMSKGLKNNRIQYEQGEESILQYVEDLKVSTKRLREGFDGKRSVNADVEEVLRRAMYIDKFMRRHPAVTGADREWTDLKQQLDILAKSWDVRWEDFGPENRPHRLNDQEVASLVESIKRNTEQVRKDAEDALKKNKGVDSQTRKNVDESFKGLIDASNQLKGKVNNNKEAAPLVEQVLRQGTTIDRFMNQYDTSDKAKNDWSRVHSDLEQLAKAYQVHRRG